MKNRNQCCLARIVLLIVGLSSGLPIFTQQMNTDVGLETPAIRQDTRLSSNQATLTRTTKHDSPNWVYRSNDEFFDDFDSDDLDSTRWMIVQRQWGGIGVNGGVVSDNVSVSGGHLTLEAHGKLYEGTVLGVNRYGIRRAHGKLVGGSIVTKQYFGSGRYEVRAKIAPQLGVSSSFVLFHYREFYPGDREYRLNAGDYNSFYTINHEIDIELPGRSGRMAYNDTSFDYALFTTWVGLNEGEFNDLYKKIGNPLDDGEFHIYRFDWHTGGASPQDTPRVDFFIDHKFICRSSTNIPDMAGRFWLQLWFPDKWTGDPDFDTTHMMIDWVRIKPFHEPNDKWVPETYPYRDGKAVIDQFSPVALSNSRNSDNPLSNSALEVENFDDDRKYNLLGGMFRSFSVVPSSARITTSSEEFFKDSGKSLMLTYSQKDPTWCGFWMRFAPAGEFLDATEYRYLTFQIKGVVGGEDVEIKISDRLWSKRDDSQSVGHIRDFLANGVTREWQKIRIPLAAVLGLDYKELNGFAILCRRGEGSIYIDEIQFEN